MSGRRWLMRASIRRVMAEAGLLAFVLALPLTTILRPALGLDSLYADVPELTSRWPVLALSMGYVGLFGGLLGALRLRRDDGKGSLRHELAGVAALAFAIWAGAYLAHLVGEAWATYVGARTPLEAALLVARVPTVAAVLAYAHDLALVAEPHRGGVPTVAAVLAYALFRTVVRACLAWDRLRRTRVLWALTHAQFIAGLTLAVVVAVLLQIIFHSNGQDGPPFGPESLPDDAGTAVLLAWVTTRLLPAASVLVILSAVLSVVMSTILLAPAALISLLVLRRTTRRLEELATAARELSAGDLAARVPVDGEDEVAQLQTTFNTMAGDLERTLCDLQAERDRVSGLLAARRQLVASVSHELRTPIATVRGYLESALRQNGAVPADLRIDLESMEGEVARLQRLIEDLFTLSRAEVGRLELRPEPTDAGAVVRRLVDTTAPLAWRQRRVQVLAEVESDLPSAHADAQRLEQIVSNLLGNAVRHTPPGGLVAAAVVAEADAIRVEIRDTGEGIAPEDLPRVFERFYRGRNGHGDGENGASPGAGLGLALTKELAEAMGGSVEATSVPGEGSRFTVRLPHA